MLTGMIFVFNLLVSCPRERVGFVELNAIHKEPLPPKGGTSHAVRVPVCAVLLALCLLHGPISDARAVPPEAQQTGDPAATRLMPDDLKERPGPDAAQQDVISNDGDAGNVLLEAPGRPQEAVASSGMEADKPAKPAMAGASYGETAPVPPVDMVEIPDAFRDALASAYTFNPQLKAEREALQALDEGVSEAFSGWRPTVRAEYDKGRRRQRLGAARQWNHFDTRTRTLEAEQPLYRGGEIMARLKGARARVKAGRARLHGTEQEVLLSAVNAYADVAEKAAVVELSRRNVEVLSRHREVTGARFEAGELTRTDVTQSDARSARALAELRNAEGDLEAARATFERVIGFQPGVYDLPDVTPSLPATQAEAVEQAIAAAPLLREAQYVEKAADTDIDVRAAALLPDVSLIGTVNRTEGSSSPNVRNFDQDSLTLNVSIPLYQSGAEYARVRAAKDRYQQARFNSADALNEAREAVTRAWHDYQASLAVIAASEKAVAAAGSALEGVQEEHQYGERTTLDVLDAEQELYTNRVRLVQARSDRITAAFTLLSATGRLTAGTLGLPVEVYDPVEHYDKVKWLPAGL